MREAKHPELSSGSEMFGVRRGAQSPLLLEPVGPVFPLLWGWKEKEIFMEKKQPKITFLWELSSDPFVLPA